MSRTPDRQALAKGGGGEKRVLLREAGAESGRDQRGGAGPAVSSCTCTSGRLMTAESYLEAAAKLRREADSLPDNMRQAWLRGAERFEAIAAEIDTD